MMESFRTGRTIYPDAMSKSLKYTASGSVYWPARYTAFYSDAGLLENLYELLKQGKPVMIGAKTPAGGQHWVTVTGFTGGPTLTAAGFKINDPGSTGRVNLKQFFADYPIFYKYFTY